MSIEQQLRQVLERPARIPDETGAYDRFLRHRRHRNRAMVAGAGLTLTLLLGLAVVAPKILPGRDGPAADLGQGRSGESLTRTEWQLTRVVEPSKTWSPPPEVEAVLRFDGEGRFNATACNHYTGPVRIDGDVLHVEGVGGTEVECSGPRRAVEEAFLAVVAGEVHWAISGEELRLDKPDGRGLRFRVRDTIYPTRDLQPLTQGQRNGGDYRFGWRTSNELISLHWEWRDASGKPWESVGMNRESTRRAPRPDPLAGSAGDDRFVFGVVPPGAARVVYQPPAGQPAVQLQLFAVPGARSWQAFGGFVDQPREGSIVVAFDDHGRELGRSDPLPS
jgi:heat shock protein HslJ